MISINLYEIFMQMVNFLILLYLLNKFLLKPLAEFIENRTATIKNDLESASKNKNESENLIEQQKQLLSDARKEAKTIREKATESSKAERTRVLAETNKEAESMISRAKDEMDLTINKLKNELLVEVGELSVDLAEKILGRTITEKDKKEIVSEGIKKLSVS